MDPVITETLCAYMGRWGMEARGIEDFQNVLREFAALDPQLVLMDIALPFFRRLPLVRRDPQNQHRADSVHLLCGR